jgi:hypothetical protein
MTPGTPGTAGIDYSGIWANSLVISREPYRPFFMEIPGQQEERGDTYSIFPYQLQTEPVKKIREGAQRQIIVRAVAQITEQPSQQYADFLFRKNLREILPLLNQLKPNLNNPEGAKFMHGFREKLYEVWTVAESLPKERKILISTLEEAIRGKRWRDLTTGQVQVLEQIVDQTESGKLPLAVAFKALHKSFIDIYPSATIDEDYNE